MAEAHPDIVESAVEPAARINGVEVDIDALHEPTLEELWESNLSFARRLGYTITHGFGRVDAAVDEAGGRQLEGEDGPYTTRPGGWMNQIAPDTSIVPLARAPLLHRWKTPVVHDKRNERQGWTVAEVLRETDGEVPGGIVGDEDVDALRLAPDTVVHRVVMVNDPKRPLRLLTGTLRELDGHKGELTRLAAYKPVIAVDDEGERRRQAPSDDDKAVIDAYARRNGFSQVSRQIITPDVIADGKLRVADPLALGREVCRGLIDLSDDLQAVIRELDSQEAAAQ